jgi:hypothetical protein
MPNAIVQSVGVSGGRLLIKLKDGRKVRRKRGKKEETECQKAFQAILSVPLLSFLYLTSLICFLSSHH